MRKFVVATKNNGKLKEISEILKDFPFEVISMEKIGILKDIEEYGTTFQENALIKAEEIYKLTGELVMADDSGIEVDYLDGAPGIYSARFAGIDATDEEKNNKLIKLLYGVEFERRTARFVCAIAVVLGEENYFTVKGVCEGYIGLEPKGINGFGYDPLFFIPEFNMTTAQMSSEDKHKISHRGKALRYMVEELKKRVSI